MKKKNSSKSKKTETTKRKTLKYRQQQQQQKMKFHWKKIKNSVFFLLEKNPNFFFDSRKFHLMIHHIHRKNIPYY